MAIHLSSLTATRNIVQPAARATAVPRLVHKAVGMTAQAPATAVSSPVTQTAAAAASGTPSWLQALFPDKGSTNTPAEVQADPGPPTAEQVFGPNPWLTNPTGMAPDGSIYGYNPQYFATPETASKVAAMVGGKVVEMNAFTNAPGTTFTQQQPNEMVQLPNGGLINPGLVAGFFTHGYPQSLVDQMVANEVTNTKG